MRARSPALPVKSNCFPLLTLSCLLSLRNLPNLLVPSPQKIPLPFLFLKTFFLKGKKKQKKKRRPRPKENTPKV